MWIRIRAVIIEDDPLGRPIPGGTVERHLPGRGRRLGHRERGWPASLCRVAAGPVFLDISLPGKDGVSLATQLAMLPQPPRLVFTTGNANRATDAFRLEAVDYLLKPLDPEQVTEAVNRLLTYLRPFESSTSMGSGDRANEVLTADKMRFTGAANELLPVKDVDRDHIRLLARREVAAVLRRERRTWVHTVREEFATYYPLADLMRWLGGDPFIQIGRHAAVNLRAIEHVIHYGDRLYRVQLRDRGSTEITASRTGAARLAAVLKTRR
jgi:DNA-binding LytR/AlgR family response regulator